MCDLVGMLANGSADHFAALDHDIWGGEAPKGGETDPGADVMQSMRELVQLMGETVRMVQEAVEPLNERLERIEAAIAALNTQEADEQPEQRGQEVPPT